MAQKLKLNKKKKNDRNKNQKPVKVGSQFAQNRHQNKRWVDVETNQIVSVLARAVPRPHWANAAINRIAREIKIVDQNRTRVEEVGETHRYQILEQIIVGGQIERAKHAEKG